MERETDDGHQRASGTFKGLPRPPLSPRDCGLERDKGGEKEKEEGSEKTTSSRRDC